MQFRRSIRQAIAVAIGLSAPLASARADSFFSFFETTDAQPASNSARHQVPTGARASQDTAAPASASTTAAVGAWRTVVIPVADQPVASRGASNLARGEPSQPLPGPRLTGTGHSLSGVASYYWQDQMTATGERFNKRDMTAAHKTLPFGTRVRVTRVDNGSSVIVRINDRGPFKPGRVIDLSERAAEEIGMTGVGLSPVRLEVLGR